MLKQLLILALVVSATPACISGSSFTMPDSAITNGGAFPVARIIARTTLPEGTVVGLTHSFTPGETGAWNRATVHDGKVAAFVTASSCFNGEHPTGSIWVEFTLNGQHDVLGSATYPWPADVCRAVESN